MQSAIRSGAEPVAHGFQFHTKFLEVIDLAVVGYNNLVLCGRHRLVTGGCQVYDRQPTVAEADEAVRIEPLAIRPPVDNSIRHLPEKNRGDRFAIQIKYTRYAAHRITVRFEWLRSRGLIEIIILIE